MSSEDKTVTIELELGKELMESLSYDSKSREIPPDEILAQWLTDGYTVAFYDAEESVVKLKHIDPWSDSDKTLFDEDTEGETSKNLKVFRRLREMMPAVTAGIEYHKVFTVGGGFEVQITNSEDKNQNVSKDIISRFNESVYQDEVTRGLDAILHIILDEVFTVGCAGVEIVYDAFDEAGSLNFHEWADPIPDPEREPKGPEFKSKVLEEEDWKKLKGIKQLKFIDNAIERLKPYRNPYTYKIEYWTVDEEEISRYNEKADKESLSRKEVPKLLPWQVLWVSWDRRGTDLKGKSLIKPVAKTAIMLEEILKAISISYKRWSDRKYFFILGDARSGRSWAPPKIRQFLMDTQQMVSSGGTGIAVPAGFDIKEIGGDAYDGANVIDRLIAMICSGMRYPRTFLEQGKTGEGDKAWLAWITTYASHQTTLRRSIEHQLWERHLYCTVGTTQRVSIQGKPVEEQDRIPVYVPKMAWKSEGKWHMEQKLDMLNGSLNVANPIGPELKIEIETDIAVTLGYSDVNLEEARKLIKMNQKTMKIEAEADKLKAELLLESLENAKKTGAHLEMIPVLQGLQEKPEVEARPPPVPLERLAGGVSRTTKETGTGNQKGVAKNLGGTRGLNVGESYQFDSYNDYFKTMIEIQNRNDKKELYTKMIETLDKIGGE